MIRIKIYIRKARTSMSPSIFNCKIRNLKWELLSDTNKQIIKIFPISRYWSSKSMIGIKICISTIIHKKNDTSMSPSIFNCKIRNCVFDKSQLSKVKFSYLVINVEWSHRCKYIEAKLPNLQLPPAHSDKEIW